MSGPYSQGRCAARAKEVGMIIISISQVYLYIQYVDSVRNGLYGYLFEFVNVECMISLLNR
jgi:hypothetical protein